MQKILEKRERALGTKLFLKAERCSSPKCALVRRPARPGVHGGRRHTFSDYGKELQEKQKMQFTYFVTNRQLRNLFRKFEGSPEDILKTLEMRLDRVVFLLGLAASPRVARQTVSHGHILVNGRKVTIPSYCVTLGDAVTVRNESRASLMFQDIPLKSKYTPPSWLEADPEALTGKCVSVPPVHETRFPFNVHAVGEFYSR